MGVVVWIPIVSDEHGCLKDYISHNAMWAQLLNLLDRSPEEDMTTHVLYTHFYDLQKVQGATQMFKCFSNALNLLGLQN